MAHNADFRHAVWLFTALALACEDDPESTQGSKDASMNAARDGGTTANADAATSSTVDGDTSATVISGSAGQITVTGAQPWVDAGSEALPTDETFEPDAGSTTAMSETSSLETNPLETMSSEVVTSETVTSETESSGLESSSETNSNSDAAPSCGAAGEACCEEAMCEQGLTCLGSGCSCAQDIAHGLVLRTDGRLLWHTGSTQTPIVDSESFESLTEVVAASTSNRHGCAATEDGILRCWAAYAGANGSQGVLGNGTVVAETLGPWIAAPVLFEADTALEDVVHLSSYAFAEGPSYPAGTCAVASDGQVWCWGASTLIQDLPNDGFAHAITANVEGDPVEDALFVSVGASHVCYLNAAGEVYCWGTNSYGSAGVGATGEVPYPTRAGALSGVSKLQASDNLTCAVVGEGNNEGQVFCWGLNSSGQLGLGDPGSNSDCSGAACKQLPTRVRVSDEEPLSDAVDIAVGKRGACAITSDGHVYCWGNVHGPLAVALSEAQRTAGQEVLTIDGNVATGPNGALWDFSNYSNDSSLRLVLKDGRLVSTRTNASVASINCGAVD